MVGTIAMLTKLKSLYDQNQFYEALTIITKEIDRLKSLRLSELKQELNNIKSAEDFQVLIRLTDHLLMYQYSSFIARYAYRRFPTLLTLTWYCEELLDNGKLLEADELVTNAIAESQEDTEVLEKLYFCKIRCLLEMKRFSEAERMLEKVKESSNALQDKLGYVYMQIGNREKAEEYFQEGLNHPEKGRICYLLLADLNAANGLLEEALAIIEMGEKHYPETPSFMLEKVRRYRDLGKMKKMLEIINELNKLIPEHAYQKYFHHLLGIAYYQLGDFASLEAYCNEEKGKKSLYTVKNDQGELIQLNIKPIIQKSNYCVPASLEMILTYFGMVTTQDEIARHIFDVTGSKLSTTVDYLEINGYECRYFVGSKERYTKLLKKNIPILLSVDFEHSSHVQVMTGYDSRFDFYHIQDPNLLDTMYMAASDLEKANVSTTYLSIVCVPKERAEELAFISMEEDEYFRRIQDLGEKIEEDEAANKEEFLEFLKVNIDVPYSAIYVVKHFTFEEYSDFILHCADKLLELYPDNDFMNLYVAQAYMRLHKMDQAREMLTRTVWKTFSPLYHFLNGRIALYFDEVKDAIGYFRNSLQLDPDQYYTWSYLALAYLYSNDVKNAQYFSSISMELAPREKFVRINHAAVLIEREQYDEARNIYDQLIKDEPADGHTWFLLGEFYFHLEMYESAAEAYKHCLLLDSKVDSAYLRLAEIASFSENRQKEAEYLFQLLDFAPLNVNIEYLVSILEKGEKRILLDKLQNLPSKINEIWRLDAEAYVYGSLGEINLEQERVNKALEIDPNFSELLHHQAKIFIKEKKWSKVREILLLLLNKDPENEDLYRTLTTYSAEANKWSRLPIFLTKLAGNRRTRSTWFLLAAEAVEQFIIEMNWSDEEKGNVFGRFVRKLKKRTKQINLFGTAIELYEMAIKLDKSNLSAVSQFAGFYEQFELIDDSIKILQKALKNNWDKHLAYQLAMNYMKKEDFSSALPLFERLLNGEPTDTHLHYMAALVHCELGELSIAEQMMKRIIGRNPFEHGVHLQLGRLYNEQGRYMEAKDILEIGREYHPYDSEISDELGLTHQHLENSIVLSN
jgi:tetratricopeptide (TPR) repeat protein